MSPVLRYDLVISDTYRGDAKSGVVGADAIVTAYRGKKFCPLVIYSSGVKPSSIVEGPFVRWADKSLKGDIEKSIKAILDSGIPQLSRKLHDEIDGSASDYLWGFLESRWEELNTPESIDPAVLERIVRRRAAIQISDLDPQGKSSPLTQRAGAEYYVYPPLTQSHLSLGDVLRSKSDSSALSVVLTPHCYLFNQAGQEKPRADFVLLASAVKAEAVLGDKLSNAKKLNDEAKRLRKLSLWSRSPADSGGKPKGRHWYLPAFLDIPHSFCDLMQVTSVPIDSALNDYESIATLAPPYAEALQSCFGSFYSSVGIPEVSGESIGSLLTS